LPLGAVWQNLRAASSHLGAVVLGDAQREKQHPREGVRDRGKSLAARCLKFDLHPLSNARKAAPTVTPDTGQGVTLTAARIGANRHRGSR